MSNSIFSINGEKDHLFSLSGGKLSIDGQEVESYPRDEGSYQEFLTEGMVEVETSTLAAECERSEWFSDQREEKQNEANLRARLMMNAPYIDYGDGTIGELGDALAVSMFLGLPYPKKIILDIRMHIMSVPGCMKQWSFGNLRYEDCFEVLEEMAQV